MASESYFYALGRRKSSTARVRLSRRKGSITINGRPAEEYLGSSKYLLTRLSRAFNELEIDPDNYTVTVKATGGGLSSQVDAMSLGIAKALVALNEDYRGTLKKADLLGRDPRERERKKFGLLSARKKRQYTKR